MINSSGNYELQGNLTYDGKENAIEVNADNVVINLNGFSFRIFREWPLPTDTSDVTPTELGVFCG